MNTFLLIAQIYTYNYVFIIYTFYVGGSVKIKADLNYKELCVPKMKLPPLLIVNKCPEIVSKNWLEDEPEVWNVDKIQVSIFNKDSAFTITFSVADKTQRLLSLGNQGVCL